MKVIIKIHGWTYNENDTAKKLIDICFQEELIPNFLQTQFSSLRAIMESGIPTIRNKLGGHGRGSQVRHIPQYLASYILHLTASTILFR